MYNLSFIGRIRGNDNNNKIGIISDNIDGEVYKAISNISLENMNDINFSNEKIKNHYIVKDGKIYLDGEEISNEMLLSEFNDNSSDYYWDYEENQFVLKKYVKQEEIKTSNIIDNKASNFSFSIKTRGASNIVAHESGLSGNTFYVNESIRCT